MANRIIEFASKTSEQSEQPYEFDSNLQMLVILKESQKIKKTGWNFLYQTPHKIKWALKYRCECQPSENSHFFAIGTRLSLHKALWNPLGFSTRLRRSIFSVGKVNCTELHHNLYFCGLRYMILTQLFCQATFAGIYLSSAVDVYVRT